MHFLKKKNKFSVFRPKSRFQVLVFFSYFRDLFSKSISDQIEELPFILLLVVTAKNTYSGASTHFLNKKYCWHFLPESTLGAFLFPVFSTSETCFWNLIFTSLKIFFAHLLVLTRKQFTSCRTSMHLLNN